VLRVGFTRSELEKPNNQYTMYHYLKVKNKMKKVSITLLLFYSNILMADMIPKAWALGASETIIAYSALSNEKINICFPGSITPSQLTPIAEKYIKEDYEIYQKTGQAGALPPSFYFIQALQSKYPCQ